MPTPPEANEPSVVIEEPTDLDPRAGRTFRDERTAAAETRTVRVGAVPPWLATPDPEPRESARDPLFWPAVVFVLVLAGAIGVMLTQSSKHPARSSDSFAPP